jgi:hypothetical protein
MTPTVVPAVSTARRTAPTSNRVGRPVRPLPLPPATAAGARPLTHGLAVVDCHGRLADRVVLSALRWQAGHRLAATAVEHTLVAVPDPYGAVAVSSDGHLRLPIGLRRRCGLRTGDRVLLVADPTANRLFLHAPDALHALLDAHHAALLQGTTP